jgi:hypothetical protein
MNEPNPAVPGIVRAVVDVAAELALANQEHENGIRAERVSLECYRKAGDALLRAKAAAGHGNWLKVLKTHSKIPQQRASEYMRLAAGWAKLPPGGNFGLKEALALIAGDDDGGTKDDTEEELIERARMAVRENELARAILNRELDHLADMAKFEVEDMKARGIDPNGEDMPLQVAYRLGKICIRARSICEDLEFLDHLNDVGVPYSEAQKYIDFHEFCNAHPAKEEQEAECERVFGPFEN